MPRPFRQPEPRRFPPENAENGRKSSLRGLLPSAWRALFVSMTVVKDTLRAIVRVGYDGRVHKTFRGPKAAERFATEVQVLKHLEAKGCPFVPLLLESDPEELKIVTTSCGTRVD